MAKWLAPVVGVVVVGVVVELVTKESRLGQFIRSIYAFFVLFVLVHPLPGWLQQLKNFSTEQTWPASSNVTSEPTPLANQRVVEQTLRELGYPQALVWGQDNAVYVNLGQAIDAQEYARVQAALGEGVYLV